MGKVIKRGDLNLGDVEPTVTDAVVPVARRAPIIERDTFEARSDADKLRADAAEEAKRVVSAAQKEADELRQRARAEGLEEGRNEGLKTLLEQVAEISKRGVEREEALAGQLKELALSIARKVIGAELQQHPDTVAQIARHALSEKARQRREVALRVNPEDLEVVRERRTELLEVLSRAREINIVGDPEVERFGVIIETDAGRIDARLDTQLAVFERAFAHLG